MYSLRFETHLGCKKKKCDWYMVMHPNDWMYLVCTKCGLTIYQTNYASYEDNISYKLKNLFSLKKIIFYIILIIWFSLYIYLMSYKARYN